MPVMIPAQEILTAYRASDPLLSASDAAAECGIGKSSFWAAVAAGYLPQPVYVTSKTPRWRASELRAAIEGRRARRAP